MPPVHELTAADLPHLGSLLAETAVLVSQPIRQNYRDLPIGTADLAAQLPAGAAVTRWPVIRYAGLYPFQVIVRHPADRSVTPPVVPYHDLRTLAAARDGLDPADDWDVEVSAEQIRAVAEVSRAELARRESRDTDVGVSDVLAAHGADAAHTINHPGNPVFDDLANRILELQDVSARTQPLPRTLLTSMYAPLEQRVLTALGLTAEPRPSWLAEQEELAPQQVYSAQLRWYADNPDYIALATERHGQVMELLGLHAAGVTR